MLRFLALVYSIAIFLMISKVLSSDGSDELVRRVDRSFHKVSSPLFFFHLLKLKKKIQKIENVPTTPPTADCICVPYYLCDANRTIIADGVGVIDIRYRRCTGDLEVCCRPQNTTTTTMKPTTTTTTTMKTTTTTTMKTTTTTKATTTTSTVPPVIFPTTESQPIPICICVSVTQCDPNGIIGNSGEGVINPRAQYIQCPSNMVCCRPTSVIQYPVVTNPPVVISPQICVLCGNAIQCNNGVVIPVNIGIVNPVVTYGQQTCPVPTSCRKLG